MNLMGSVKSTLRGVGLLPTARQDATITRVSTNPASQNHAEALSSSQRGRTSPRPSAKVHAIAEGHMVAPPTHIETDRVDEREWAEFLKSFTSLHQERSYWVPDAQVEGTIPKELEGTLLKNGPGQFEIGGQRVAHPFDGDGMVAAFAFKEGRCFFSNRFVRTKAYTEEQRAGRMLYRGAFSAGNPGGKGFFNPFKLDVKGIANTGVVRWGGRTLALYERDMPYELESPDLKTLGTTDADGALKDTDPYFGAHYRITTDADGKRTLIGFSSSEVGSQNRLTVWEFDEDFNRLTRTQEVFKGAFGFYHDFAMTEKYYVFLQNPIRLNLYKFVTQYMLGKAGVAECLEFDTSQKSLIHLIPRPGKGGTRGTYETTPFFAFHHCNAFESADGKTLILDTVAELKGVIFSAKVEGPDTVYGREENRGSLTRLSINLASGKVDQRVLIDRSVEFPSVASTVVAKPHRHIYMVGDRFNSPDTWGPVQVICKVSVSEGIESLSPKVSQDVYYPGRSCWVHEPVFVPRPNAKAEDDGWVLAMVNDSTTGQAFMAILEAQDLAAGPIAKIHLKHHYPQALHGSWSPDFIGPDPKQPYEPRLHDTRGVDPLVYA